MPLQITVPQRRCAIIRVPFSRWADRPDPGVLPEGGNRDGLHGATLRRAAPCRRESPARIPAALPKVIHSQGLTVAEKVKQYELCVLIRPDIEEGVLDGVVSQVQDLITSRGGEILRTDRWNKRYLAYPIKKYTEGYYVIVRWLGTGDALADLNYQLRYNDNVLRHMILNYTETERKRKKRTGGKKENGKAETT
jgi:small subunit ribosomal protein S6